MLARQKDDLNTAARIGAAGPGQPDPRLRQQDQLDRLAGLQVEPNGASLGNMLCDIVVQLREFPGDTGSRPATCSRRSSQPFSDQIGADPAQNQSQPAQLKLGGSAPATALDGLLSALKAGNASMSRVPAQARSCRARSPRWCSCWSPPCSPPAASSTAPTTCRCPAATVSEDDAIRSPPSSPTPSTWCRAPRCSSTTCRSARSPRSTAWAGTRRSIPGPQGHRAAGEHRDRRPPDQPAGREVRRPGRARRRYGERRSGSPTATSSRCPAPAATRRSRRSSGALSFAAQRRRRRPAQDDQPRDEQR